MIVFGYNNFLIKSYTPAELGYPQEEGAVKLRFEIRQRYAHIFWIPFFPIGKFWVMRRAGDNNKYEVPQVMLKLVENLEGQVRTPWYSFSVFLLAIAAGFIFWVNNFQEEQRMKDAYYNRIEESKMLVQYPTTGDYYVFKRYLDPAIWSSQRVIYKVKSYTDDKVELISMNMDPYQEIEDGYNYHKEFDKVETYAYNATMVDKNELKNAVDREYKDSNRPVKIAPLDGFFRLEEIDRRNLTD